MSQFAMNAEITLKANAAIKSIQNFEKGTKNTQKEFSLLGRTIALDTSRMKKNLAGMAIIAGGLFAGILKQSPHLRAEFKRLEASTLLFNVALGEKLQPTIEFLVNVMITLQEKFLALPEPIQEVILITGFLTVVLIAATFAAIGLWAALGPITLVILGIALVVALLITYWDEFVFAIEVGWNIIKIVFILFGKLIVWVGEQIWNFIVNVIGKGFVLAALAIGDFVRGAGDTLGNLWESLLIGFDGFIDGIWIGIHGVVNGLKTIFTGIGDFFKAIINPIIDGFVWVINKAIDAYNAIAGAIGADKVGHIGGGGGGGTNYSGTLGGGFTVSDEERDIFRGAAEGRDIQKDGLIFAHRDERISTKSETRANRRGGAINGGTTVNNYNTFKIGSVDSKKRVREMMKEANRLNKRDSDRRFKV